MSYIYILHTPHSVKLWWSQTLVNLTNYHSITKYNPRFLKLIIAGHMPGETLTLNYFQCALIYQRYHASSDLHNPDGLLSANTCK